MVTARVVLGVTTKREGKGTCLQERGYSDGLWNPSQIKVKVSTGPVSEDTRDGVRV